MSDEESEKRKAYYRIMREYIFEPQNFICLDKETPPQADQKERAGSWNYIDLSRLNEFFGYEEEQTSLRPPWGVLLFSMILGAFNQLFVYPAILAKISSAFFH